MLWGMRGDDEPAAGKRRAIMWYVRIGMYLIVLALVVFVGERLRGRIPEAFGLTPVAVKALSVDRLPAGGAPGDTAADIAVTVRIVGRKKMAEGLSLGQFHLVTKRGTRLAPLGSTLAFDRFGKLHISVGDTAIGVLLYRVPPPDEPKELWWQP